MRFEIFLALRLGEGEAVARQVGKTLQVERLKVVTEVVPDVVHEVVNESITLNLFDIDPCKEPESPINIDLDLDQLEDPEE